MEKWADYLVSGARLTQDGRFVEELTAHIDDGDLMGCPLSYSRDSVLAAMKAGTLFVTVNPGSDGTWQRGKDLGIVALNGAEYLKTDLEHSERDLISFCGDIGPESHGLDSSQYPQAA